MKYAVVDSQSKKVINIAEWDGIAPWNPGVDLFAVKSDIAAIGNIYDIEKDEFS